MTSTAGEFSKLNITADWASTAPNLHKNLSLLSPQQVELAKVLIEMGQTHLFQHWAEPGVDDEEKRAFFDQIAKLNSSYPGGLAAYINTARKLLADSKAGKNPYDGFTPSGYQIAMLHYEGLEESGGDEGEEKSVHLRESFRIHTGAIDYRSNLSRAKTGGEI